MLHLIRAHGHQIRLVQQNIRRHQHRIGKQACRDIIRMLLRLILELRHASQLAELGIAAQHPAELRMLGYMALDKHDILFRIQAAGDILRQLRNGPAAQIRRVLPDRNGVHIHNAEQAVIFVLQRRPVLDGAHIGTQGQLSAGLNAGKNTLLCVHEKNLFSSLWYWCYLNTNCSFSQSVH